MKQQKINNEEELNIFDAVIDENGKLQILPAAWVQQKINKLTQIWKPANIPEHGVVQACIASDVKNMNKEIVNKIKYNDVPFIPSADCSHYEECREDAYQQGIEDAINNFVNNAMTEFKKFEAEHGYPTLGDIEIILGDVAEKLKEKKNG